MRKTENMKIDMEIDPGRSQERRKQYAFDFQNDLHVFPVILNKRFIEFRWISVENEGFQWCYFVSRLSGQEDKMSTEPGPNSDILPDDNNNFH